MSDINMTIIKRDGSRVPYNNEKSRMLWPRP